MIKMIIKKKSIAFSMFRHAAMFKAIKLASGPESYEGLHSVCVNIKLYFGWQRKLRYEKGVWTKQNKKKIAK